MGPFISRFQRLTDLWVANASGRWPRLSHFAPLALPGFAQKRVPRSRGQPAGRLGQPFYGWLTCARLIYEAALAVFPPWKSKRPLKRPRRMIQLQALPAVKRLA